MKILKENQIQGRQISLTSAKLPVLSSVTLTKKNCVYQYLFPFPVWLFSANWLRTDSRAASAAAWRTVSFDITPDVNSAWALAMDAPVLRYNL